MKNFYPDLSSVQCFLLVTLARAQSSGHSLFVFSHEAGHAQLQVPYLALSYYFMVMKVIPKGLCYLQRLCTNKEDQQALIIIKIQQEVT